MNLSIRNRSRLVGVHPDLVRVVERAFDLCPPEISILVLEGLRSRERQVQLVKVGASQRILSRHLTGHAVDLGVVLDGQLRWDWPLYDRLAGLMQRAAEVEKVPLEWGGHWTSLKDGPHFQLPDRDYPANPPERSIA